MMAGVLYTYALGFVIRLRDFRGKTRSVGNDEAMSSMLLSMVSVTVSCCVSISNVMQVDTAVLKSIYNLQD